MRYYTKNDEYALVKGDQAYLGLSKAGVENLGDVTFVELPKVGAEVKKGEAVCAVEAVKAAVDYYAPLSGKVVEVNAALKDKPELLNKDPEGQAWILLIQMTDPKEIEDLLSEELYLSFLADDQ